MYEPLSRGGLLSLQQIKVSPAGFENLPMRSSHLLRQTFLQRDLDHPAARAKGSDVQTLLTSLRVVQDSHAEYLKMTSTARVLHRFACLVEFLVPGQAISGDVYLRSWAETELLHRIFALLTLMVEARNLFDELRLAEGLTSSTVALTAYRATCTFTVDTFAPDAAARVLAVLRRQFADFDAVSSEPSSI